MSVAFSDRRRPADFRYAPLATDFVWQWLGRDGPRSGLSACERSIRSAQCGPEILSIMFCTFAGVLTQRTASGLTHRGW
jgi:hypothetical protein